MAEHVKEGGANRTFPPQEMLVTFSPLGLWCGDVRPVRPHTVSLNLECYILNVHPLIAIQAWWPVKSASPPPLMCLVPAMGWQGCCLSLSVPVCLGSIRISLVASELLHGEQLLGSSRAKPSCWPGVCFVVCL